jgi:phage gp16-like protein
MTALRKPFAANPHRRVMIAKVKLAQKQLGVADDDYRALLARVTGKRSAADLTETELGAVIAEFTRMGFKPVVGGVGKSKSGLPARRVLAAHPSAKKARAMWISLAQLGAVRDASEAALESFARRQLGVERLAWSDGADVYRLIEALKAIATRHGWSQELAGVAAWTHTITLKRRLVGAIHAKIIAAAPSQPATPELLGKALAIHAFGPLDTWTDEACERAAQAFAAVRSTAEALAAE